MAEENGNGGGDAASPRFSVVAQYVKDFSFENPNAPRTFGQQPAGLNLQDQRQRPAGRRRPITRSSLLLEGGAGEGPGVVFKFELHYAGVFRIENVPADQVQPLVMIEGPRLLFPFARQIIADAVRGGGYPPLYVDPIDFHALYLQRLAAAGGRGRRGRPESASAIAVRRRNGVQSQPIRRARRRARNGRRCSAALGRARRQRRAAARASTAATGPRPAPSRPSRRTSDRCRPPVSSP